MGSETYLHGVYEGIVGLCGREWEKVGNCGVIRVLKWGVQGVLSTHNSMPFWVLGKSRTAQFALCLLRGVLAFH